MTEQRVSSRYARAVIETASKEGLLDTVYKDFIKVLEIINSNKDLRNLLHSPVVKFWQKKKILNEIFEPSINKLTLSFILLLADKHRENLIPDIIVQYQNQYNKINNLLPVSIISAVELDDNLKTQINNKIENYSKMKIIPAYKVDRSIKAGLLIKIDDWVFDASLRNQLDSLYKRLID